MPSVFALTGCTVVRELPVHFAGRRPPLLGSASAQNLPESSVSRSQA